MSELSTFVFGPPGTGKTTWAVNHIKRCIDEYGYEPERIVCISFTKSAAKEIRTRSNGLIPEENAATLHALCYRALGRPGIAEKKLSEFTGEPGSSDDEIGFGYSDSADDEYSVTNIWRQQMRSIDKWPDELLTWNRDYRAWKDENNLFDFTDMLEQCLIGELNLPKTPKVIIVDEAQDTTTLQRAVIEQFGKYAEEIVWIGDDDQCIYDWAGADSAFLIDGSKQSDPIILGKSYRLNQEIRDYALRFIENNVQTRVNKHFEASKHFGGLRSFDGSYRDMGDIGELIKSRDFETFMILAHTNKMIDQIGAQLREQGIPFHNPYRKSHGGWNPLSQRDGSMVGQLVQLKRNKIITGKLLENIKSECFAGRGIKTKIAKEGKEQYFGNEIGEFLQPAICNALNSFDLMALSDMVMPKYRDKLAYIRACSNGFGDDWIDNRVIIGTFHSVKGGEADNVVLMPDCSMRGWRAIQDGDGDSIHRAFYVGMTRAKYNLFIGNCATHRDILDGF